MKNLAILLFLILLIIFSACSDEGFETESLNYSNFNSSVTSTDPMMCCYDLVEISSATGDDGQPCESLVEFVFILDTGEEFISSYVPADGPPPSICLPDGHEFSMFIRSKLGQSSCGDFEWALQSEGEACPGTFTHFVESRPDLISINRPQYVVTLPHSDEITTNCECPDVEEEPCANEIEFPQLPSVLCIGEDYDLSIPAFDNLAYYTIHSGSNSFYFYSQNGQLYFHLREPGEIKVEFTWTHCGAERSKLVTFKVRNC